MSKRAVHKRPKSRVDLLGLAKAGKLELSPHTRIDTPNMPGVSVTLIIKNCAEHLTRLVASLKKNFLLSQDEVVCLDTGSTDDTPEVARKLGCRVIVRADLRQPMGEKVKQWLPEYAEKFGGEAQFTGGCLMDFAGARQIVTDAAKNDLIFWLDSDDVFEEKTPFATRKLVGEMVGTKVDALFLNYLYAFDKNDGRPTAVLKRERIVDRRKYVWKGKCHETLIPRDGVQLLGAGYVEDLPAVIVHAHGRSDSQLSDIRNYIIIRTEVENDLLNGRTPDVRSIFYLGNAARGLRRHIEAVQMYNKTLDLSGSRDDRFSAAYYIAITYLSPDIQRPLEALDYGFRCIKLKPDDPRGWFLISRCYHLLARHEECLQYFEYGRALKEPTNTLHTYDPEHIHTLPYFIAISAAKELKDEGRVREYVEYLRKHRPNHPDVGKITDAAQNFIAAQELVRAVKNVTTNSRPVGQMGHLEAARKVVNLIAEVPDELESMGVGKLEGPDPRNPRVAKYTNEAGEDVTEVQNIPLSEDVVIWCGHTLEPWGPKTDGIGGSEKAVIQMAKRLQKRGLNVTVYCNVPRDQRGIDPDTGVLWHHWSAFDHMRRRGTVIFWRNVGALELPWPINRRIYWGHDVQRADHWTDARIAAADEIWLLSEFHFSTLPEHLRAKIEPKLWITRNGIDADLFRRTLAETPSRTDKSVVYCSSPDRGLLSAIKAFQSAYPADKHPDAVMHVCYGFNKNYRDLAAKQEYGSIPDVNRDMSYYDYMSLCFSEMDKDPRVKYYGRVDGRTLAKIMCSSTVWLYPTRFPEISCMSAMEAQAAGLAIVATTHGALAETLLGDLQFTLAFPEDPSVGEKIRKASSCYDDARRKAAEIACDVYDYETLADTWVERIKEGVAVV